MGMKLWGNLQNRPVAALFVQRFALPSIVVSGSVAKSVGTQDITQAHSAYHKETTNLIRYKMFDWTNLREILVVLIRKQQVRGAQLLSRN